MNIWHNRKAVVLCIPSNNWTYMSIYCSIYFEPLRLLFSVFNWMNLMAQSMREAFFWRDLSKLCFSLSWFLLLMICTLHLKNHLSGSIVVVFQVFFLLYVVKSYQSIFNSFSDCLNHGFQTFATITASLMFMGTISLKLRVLGITWKNTYNGQGKDYHPSWQCIQHSVFKYRLAPLRVLRTSSHHFEVAPPSSNSFTILCIASNPAAPLTAVLSSPRRERLWEASLTCKILMTFVVTRWSPEPSFKILVP